MIQNKTVLIIAHRMRTIANVDHIVLLKDGLVAEEGTPAELTAFIYWSKSKEVKRSIKYTILLALCRFFGLQKIMELPPQKAKQLFARAYKGVVIPDMKNDELNISTEDIKGSTCLWYRHKDKCDRACVYLIGGGMFNIQNLHRLKRCWLCQRN